MSKPDRATVIARWSENAQHRVRIIGDDLNRQIIQRQWHVERMLPMTKAERVSHLALLEIRGGAQWAQSVREAYSFAVRGEQGLTLISSHA